MNTNVRNTDKFTSHEAAEFMESSGFQGKMIERVVGMITNSPNKTGKELADEYGFADTGVVTKRISDAERKGYIESSDTRKCSITGRTAQVWNIV